jgi:hypothetical protein
VTQKNEAWYVTGTTDANTIAITQTGGGYNEGNILNWTKQDGSGNSQDVTQTGTLNYINTISQTGVGPNSLSVDMGSDQNAINAIEQQNDGGSTNFVNITLSGSQNRTGSAGGITQYGAGAPNGAHTVSIAGFDTGSDAGAVVGVFESEIHQTGGYNDMISYSASGNYNLFGFTQLGGSSNTINGIVSGSDSNEAAVYQDGTGNIVDFTQQGGGSNDLGVSMTGNDNQIHALQEGAGSNKISVSITGSNNNNYPTSAAINGDALTAKLFAETELGAGNLTQGKLIQNGSNNELSLLVATSTNVFATYQHGDGNVIDGTVNTGNGNQAVVTQIGSNETAVFTQSGDGNNVGIKQ